VAKPKPLSESQRQVLIVLADAGRGMYIDDIREQRRITFKNGESPTATLHSLERHGLATSEGVGDGSWWMRTWTISEAGVAAMAPWWNR